METKVGKHYYGGSPCKRGHNSARLISTGACVECMGYLRKRWREKNPQAHRDHNRKYAQNNPDKVASRWRNWRDNNKEHWLAWLKENRNRDDIRAKRGAEVGRRRAAKLQACPKWVDHRELDRIYQAARAISKATGIPHHVDHIIPLTNPLVCGLHVPWNLQIITARENLQKSNRFSCDDGI